jgi:hypothetical protein
MNEEIETEVAHFPEKEYINGIFVAVFVLTCRFAKICKKVGSGSVSVLMVSDPKMR